MAGTAQESQADLERQLAERTRELSGALARESATSEILGVISRSPTDLQPVFDCILENATRLCDARLARLGLYDGEKFEYVAQRGDNPEFARDFIGVPFVPDGVNLRRILLEGCVVHVPDRQAQAIRASRHAPMLNHGARTLLGVPMLKNGRAVGAIIIYRQEVKLFTESQIALVTTFASQAVIAIENVRLFKELQARNAEITESLEQQTATGEILRAISRSLSDIQPVLDAVVANAARLCHAEDVIIRLVEGETNRAAAHCGSIPVPGSVRKFSRKTLFGRAVLDCETVHVHDVEDEAVKQEFSDSHFGDGTFRSGLFVPLVRDGNGIGAIVLRRKEVQPFSPDQISLIETFAAQATIAIENVRLFGEIQQKSTELEVANRHKSEFLAGMSHELRTPLNAILGFSEVLAERMFGDINEKQAEYLEDIRASGTHLLSLINDILDLAKIEAGRMELELSTFDVPSALENALTLVRERATRHGIALSLSCEPGIETWTADERKFKQIMLNLLSNAVKFTPPGGTITVKAARTGDRLEISVTDSGVGISVEDQALVFDEFRQVGGDRGRKAEGTGLGLALTRRFVELHGGSIGVQSEVGKGATFRFSVPEKVQ